MGGHRLYHYPFVTFKTPHCIWEYDLPSANRAFLDEIDPTYFDALAGIYADRVREDGCQASAVALRSLYFQGLENFFALIGALIQAPGAVPAWLLEYQGGEVKSIVSALHEDSTVMSHINREISGWFGVSKLVHRGLSAGEGDKKRTIEHFSNLWRRFAGDFLDDNIRHEYNSIKHGLRIHPGGFGLKVRSAGEPGTGKKPGPLVSLGSSKYGSSFYKKEKLDKKGLNFRVRRQSLNWNPENVIWGAHFVSLSINNVVACLKGINGTDPAKINFQTPKNEADYDKPWSHLTGGPQAFDMALNLTEKDIEPFSKSTVLDSYVKNKDNDGAASDI